MSIVSILECRKLLGLAAVGFGVGVALISCYLARGVFRVGPSECEARVSVALSLKYNSGGPNRLTPELLATFRRSSQWSTEDIEALASIWGRYDKLCMLVVAHDRAEETIELEGLRRALDLIGESIIYGDWRRAREMTLNELVFVEQRRSEAGGPLRGR